MHDPATDALDSMRKKVSRRKNIALLSEDQYQKCSQERKSTDIAEHPRQKYRA
jgi:hypothetical protein